MTENYAKCNLWLESYTSTFINVKGDVNLTVDGNFETLVKGNYNIRAKNLNIEVEQDMDTIVLRDTTERYEKIFKTTALGAVSQRYNDTFDGVYKGNTTLTYGDKLDSSIKGAVPERYADTVDRRRDGIQTEIYKSTVNLTSTEGSININSGITFNVNAVTLDLDGTTVDIDGTTTNINAATLAVNAPSSNILGTAGATILHGTTSATVDTPSTSESELKITEIIDVDEDQRVRNQSSERTDKAGTGGYNPTPEFDYPIPAVVVRATEEERKSQIEAKGIETTNKNT